MKAPATADLMKSLQAGNAPAEPAEKAKETIIRKSYTLGSEEIAHITAIARHLGEQQSKVVSASEALRAIILAHKESQQ